MHVAQPARAAPFVARELVRARRPERRPVVLTRAELARLLRRLEGITHLMASLLYGGGLRLGEIRAGFRHGLVLYARDTHFEKCPGLALL